MRRWLLATLVAAPGCGTNGGSGTATEAWVGRWNGPEGTYLEIVRIGGAYEVTIKDLDAARTFIGSATDDGIDFRRDGVTESIEATNGVDTGMKWLAGKANCLTIKPGEGFCRD